MYWSRSGLLLKMLRRIKIKSNIVIVFILKLKGKLIVFYCNFFVL